MFPALTRQVARLFTTCPYLGDTKQNVPRQFRRTTNHTKSLLIGNHWVPQGHRFPYCLILGSLVKFFVRRQRRFISPWTRHFIYHPRCWGLLFIFPFLFSVHWCFICRYMSLRTVVSCFVHAGNLARVFTAEQFLQPWQLSFFFKWYYAVIFFDVLSWVWRFVESVKLFLMHWDQFLYELDIFWSINFCRT